SGPNVKAGVVIGGALGVIAALLLLMVRRGAAARSLDQATPATDGRGDLASAKPVNDPDPWVAELSEESTRR
ncbi:MAG TPA: hypothetical protein VEC09_00980, partial [Actinomycetota bacterium]|nr:hypothetical protein [Actinomycetota bacterium]